MRKRTLCTLCALALCAAMASPARAAGNAAPSEKAFDPTHVTWEELGDRVRAGSFNALAVEEQIQQIESIDYEFMEKNLRDTINELGKAQTSLREGAAAAGQQIAGAANAVGLATAMEMQTSLSSAYDAAISSMDSLRTMYDDVRSGTTKKDNEDAIRLLKDGVEQIVAGSQSLYLSTLGLERTYADGMRGIDTIDRSLAELRLREKLGQVSHQTILGLEQTRANTVTQLATLESGITTCKAQLQALMGEEPTGELTLGALPDLDDALLDAMDPEADLAAAKEKSAALFSAEKTWKDAKKAWVLCPYPPSSYLYKMDEHKWNAAQMTYQSAIQNYETAFHTLCRTIEDDRAAVENKKEAVAYAQTVLNSEQTRYDRGIISLNKLADAKDSLAAAQSELEGAKMTLYQDYHAYENAVKFGILNQGGAQ